MTEQSENLGEGARTPALPQIVSQRAARWAWQRVGVVENSYGTLAKDYLALARGLPSRLQTTGLGQTLAFLAASDHTEAGAKPGSAEALMLHHLADWICTRVFDKRQVEGKILDVITSLSTSDYRRATREVEAVSQWLKRFAESVLAREE